MRLTHIVTITMILCALIISCDQQTEGEAEKGDAAMTKTEVKPAEPTQEEIDRAAMAAKNAPPPPVEDPSLQTLEARASYGMGIELGQQLAQMKQMGFDIDKEAFLAGFTDVFDGKELKMTQAQIRQAQTEFQQKMMESMMGSQQPDVDPELAANNLKASQEFLAANAKKDGVKTTESGLQYEVLKSGDGESPALQDNVVAHYHGTLIDGTKFDSSYDRGEPATFPLQGVIPGWTEALQLMKVGDKWRLYIPSELAYGPRGSRGAIGPNQALIFDVELLEVQHPHGHSHDHGSHEGHSH